MLLACCERGWRFCGRRGCFFFPASANLDEEGTSGTAEEVETALAGWEAGGASGTALALAGWEAGGASGTALAEVGRSVGRSEELRW